MSDAVQQISDLMFRYAELFDTGQFDEFAALSVLEQRRELVELPGVEQLAVAVHQRGDLLRRVRHASRSSRDARTIPAAR